MIEIRSWPRIILAVAAVVYLVVSASHLSTYPVVGEDEPWIAAAPVKLATQGILGNDLFTGYYGMERHFLQHMPVYPILEAAAFKLCGVGVWQMRLPAVACGLLVLLAVFLTGAQMGGEWVGALAVALLIALRITAGEEGTGILLLDRVRVNRYDIAVPVFGLLALWTFNRARGSLGVGTAGFLAGLAGLSHLYGLFWLPVLGVLTAVRFRGRRLATAAAWLLGGFLVPWVPWLAYLVPRWSDYVGQLKPASGRFDLLNPHFYVQNLVYADGPLSLGWVARSVRELPWNRFGSLVLVWGIAASAFVVVRAIRRREISSAAMSVVVAGVLQALLFSALLVVKSMAYMIALWPLVALVIAWSAVGLWQHTRLITRIGLLIVMALVVGEASGRIVRSLRAGRRVSSYDFYTAQVGACIPAGSRVIGFQHYWLGLRQFEFRSWLLPIYMSRPGWYGEGLTFGQALGRVNPTILLVDRYFSALLEENAAPDKAYHSIVVDVNEFMTERRAQPLCSVRDQSYGTMLVYRLAAPL